MLEAGCGGGQHTVMMAQHARTVTAADLNTSQIAAEHASQFPNVRTVEADIATINLGRRFDIVVCIGVIHHTDDPDATLRNLVAHVAPGGALAVWAYSAEGNFLVRHGVEPIRKLFLRRMSRSTLVWLSRLVTALMYPPVYTVYLLPLSFLPYYAYFKNFRRLSFGRNILNVFDKLNAPQTQFITRERATTWLSHPDIDPDSVSIRHYAGVSWGMVARTRNDGMAAQSKKDTTC